VLHGRERERALIAKLLQGARSGVGGVLVVSGEAGTGKSSLLADAAASAEGMQVLRTQGVESEAPLAFAALQRLLQPLMPLADRLPPPQARALRVVFGYEAAEPGGPGGGSDRFLVFLAALSLLAEAAEEQPVLAIVDDAHWLDDASAAALQFVARRLEQEPVVMLFGAREGDVRSFDAGDLPTMRLPGLELAAVTSLLRDQTGNEISPEVGALLLASTGGNPLALKELPQVLTPEQLTGHARLPGRLPVTGTIERVFLDRARRLSTDAQRVLLIAAADDSARVATVSAAATQLGVDVVALGEAESSGLVRVDGRELQLRHPLVRSAVYSAATSIDRRRTHAALAAVLTMEEDADRRAWHRAASVDEPDAGVVAELDAAAGRAEQRGGHEAAAAAWERAAELTADPAARGERLYRAAQAAWLSGHPAGARHLADSAQHAVSEPSLRADVDLLRARIEWNTGSVKLGHRMVLEGARDVFPFDPEKAREMAMFGAALAAYGGDSGVDVEPAEFAALPEGATLRQRCFAENLLALRAVAAGDWKRATVLARQAFTTGAHLELGDQDLLPNLAITAVALGDAEAAGSYHQRLLTRARGNGAAVVVLYSLTRMGFTDVPAGDWSGAASRMNEAVRLAEGTEQQILLAGPLSWLVLLAALRGEDNYGTLLERVEALMETQALGTLDVLIRDAVRWAKGVHASPRSGAAFHHLAQMSHHTMQRMAGIDRIEAAVHADQLGTARLWIDDLNRFGEATEQQWASAAAAHGEALLASVAGSEEADTVFERALAMHAHTRRPFDRARTELAYGEHLRRNRQRVAARDHLRSALEAFEDLRAVPWADRAAQELRASGETARKRDVSTATDLTPQEQQVAQLVQQGLTNKEVAAQLFVSPRTVDFHLRNVFAKTGVTSRVELARLTVA
jgi:DNA-binding CsgD family transcriptional regulator